MPAFRALLTSHIDVGASRAGVIARRSYGDVMLSLHRPPETAWRWQGSDAPERAITAMVFPIAGDVLLEWDGGTATADATTGLVLASSDTAQLTWHKDALAAIVWLPTAAVNDFAAVPRLEPGLLTDTDLVHAMRAIVVSAAHRRTDPAGSSYSMARLLAGTACGILLERAGLRTPVERVATPLEVARAHMLRNRARADYGSADLAQEMHMSTRQLQRIFSRVGSSPTHELRRMRMDLAAALLANMRPGSLTIDGVAARSGFGSASSLRRAFAREGRALPQRRGAAAIR